MVVVELQGMPATFSFLVMGTLQVSFRSLHNLIGVRGIMLARVSPVLQVDIMIDLRNPNQKCTLHVILVKQVHERSQHFSTEVL